MCLLSNKKWLLPVFSLWKSLQVLQKARIKIMACAIYTYLFFSYIYTILFCCKIKRFCAGLQKLRARLRPWMLRECKQRYWFLYVKVIWICPYVRLFFCPVLGWFYQVLLPVRAISCENSQLSTGAINLSQLKTTFHPPTQTIMI